MMTNLRLAVNRMRLFRNFRMKHNVVNQKSTKSTFDNGKNRHLVLKTVASIFGASVIGWGGWIAYNEVTESRNRRMDIESIRAEDAFHLVFGFYKYKGYVFVGNLLKYIHNGRLENFDVREDDVWIITFPRSGTTLTAEMVYLIVNDLNFKKAKEEFLAKRAPFFGVPMIGPFEDVEQCRSPRIIRTHIPLPLLPKQIEEKKPKIIYVARNPKDVWTSWYHFIEIFPDIHFKFRRPTKEKLFEAFLVGNLPFGPWWRHVREYWEIRGRENILFLKYEDIVKEPANTVKKISSFLGKRLTDEDIQQVVEHCKIDRMKVNPKVNFQEYKEKGIVVDSGFIRKGKVGDWKNIMSPETAAKVDDMVKTELGECGLTFSDN